MARRPSKSKGAGEQLRHWAAASGRPRASVPLQQVDPPTRGRGGKQICARSPDTDRGEGIREVFRRAIRLHEQVMRMDPSPILAAADAIAAALTQGGKVLVFGNGGSASDSQHFAAELVGRFQEERRGLPAMALTADASVLTSIANDYGYEHVFARQIQALGRPGDVVFGISTSGASPNVVAALKAARRAGLRVIALTGRDGGLMATCAEIHINIPNPSTPRIQEVHRTVLHIICELVEGQVPTGSGQAPDRRR